MNIYNKKINMRKNKGCYRHPLYFSWNNPLATDIINIEIFFSFKSGGESMIFSN